MQTGSLKLNVLGKIYKLYLIFLAVNGRYRRTCTVIMSQKKITKKQKNKTKKIAKLDIFNIGLGLAIYVHSTYSNADQQVSKYNKI